MAEPVITFSINNGTEGVPVWVTVTALQKYYFCGAGSGAVTCNNETRPAAGCIVVSELWKGDSPYGNGVQCTTYTGAVNTNRYVLKFNLNVPAASNPELTAYDDVAAATAKGNCAVQTKEMIVGTAGSTNFSWLKAYNTTAGAPPPGWTSCGDDVYDLCGNDHKIDFAGLAAGDYFFNIVCYLPSDSGAGTTGHDPVLTVQYTYT